MTYGNVQFIRPVSMRRGPGTVKLEERVLASEYTVKELAFPWLLVFRNGTPEAGGTVTTVFNVAGRDPTPEDFAESSRANLVEVVHPDGSREFIERPLADALAAEQAKAEATARAEFEAEQAKKSKAKK